MRSIITASISAVALYMASGTAFASSHVYSTPEAAQATCAQSEVVWMDLNRSVYLHKSQSDYGRSGGAYACLASARERGFTESKAPIQQASKPN